MSDVTGARRALPGVAVAGVTAVVSGVSVFVNSYGVRHVGDAAVYTTAKNLVAALVLVALLAAALPWRVRRSPVASRPGDAPALRGRAARWLALGYVGVVGGGLAFVLFFEGLARTTPTPAAFVHDTMVIWVALIAGVTLRERLTPWNLLAIALLLGGAVAFAGGVGALAWTDGLGLVLVATVLWAVETVIAKRLLVTIAPELLAVVRMGVGALFLLAYLAATGGLSALVHLDASQLGWVALTGGLLACYVATWMVALQRARALDVTSVLVASVAITALLERLAGTPATPHEPLGFALVGIGVMALLVAWPRMARAR